MNSIYIYAQGDNFMSIELTHEQKMQRMEQESFVAGGAFVLKILKEHYGEEVCHIFAKLQGEKILEDVRKKSEEIEDKSIDSYIKLLYEPCLALGNELTIEKTDEGVQLYCGRCMPHDGAKRHGLVEEGYYIACSTDPYLIEGFNPNIGLKRTKTKMQGHDCCDHFFYYKDKNKQS